MKFMTYFDCLVYSCSRLDSSLYIYIYIYRDVTTTLRDLRNGIELFCKEAMDISCSSESGMSKKGGGIFNVKIFK